MKFRVFLSVFLCIALSFSLCSVAFADSTTFSVTATWNGRLSDGTSTWTTVSTAANDPGAKSGVVYARCTTLTIVFPSAGTATIAFDPGGTVTNVTNCKSWVIDSSGSVCGVTVESDMAGTVTCTITSNTKNTSYVTMSASFKSENQPDDPSNDGTGSMNGWTGLKLRDVENGGQHWVIYNSEIGELITMVTLGEGSYESQFWIAKMLSHFGYSSWKWSFNEETGKIDFELPEDAQGSWMDMIYRFSTYDYWWNSKLWSGDVAGSWYGNLSGMLTQSLGVLNATVKQIQDVLSNDKDLAIKNATENERQWIQDYYEGNSDYKVDEAKIQDFSDTGDEFSAFLAGGETSSLSVFWSLVNGQNEGYLDFWSNYISDMINFGANHSTRSRSPRYSSVPSFFNSKSDIVSSAFSGGFDNDDSIFEPFLFGGDN